MSPDILMYSHHLPDWAEYVMLQEGNETSIWAISEKFLKYFTVDGGAIHPTGRIVQITKKEFEDYKKGKYSLKCFPVVLQLEND